MKTCVTLFFFYIFTHRGMCASLILVHLLQTACIDACARTKTEARENA